MTSSPDFSTPAVPAVALRPPLALVDSGAGAGVAEAMTPVALLVRFASGQAKAQGPLTLHLASGRTVILHGPIETSHHDQDQGLVQMTFASAEARLALADLLTLVRKSQHIEICASRDIEASDRYTGFSDVVLKPKALPELAWDQLDTGVEFLGRCFQLPLLITGMTGGLAQGAEINLRLARAAAAAGIPMGVGSQRVALDQPAHAPIFAVKKAVPELFLLANVGMAQVRGPGALELCERAVRMIDADALAIHVNVLQELVQVEGDRDFRGVLPAIAAVARGLSVPVVVKEVGAGLDPESARYLLEAGVKALDCGGKGGTSWSFIEGERTAASVPRAIAASFRDWGIPTAVAVALLHDAVPAVPLIATGGLRDGLDVAKAVALGATLCGIGLPLLKAALVSEAAVHEALLVFATGLKTAMLCSGADRLRALPARLYQTPAFREQQRRYQPAAEHPATS